MVRDSTGQEKLSELVFNWRFWDIISYAGLSIDSTASCETVETKAYYPKVFGWKAMAEESLRQVATALERLAINQASQFYTSTSEVTRCVQARWQRSRIEVVE